MMFTVSDKVTLKSQAPNGSTISGNFRVHEKHSHLCVKSTEECIEMSDFIFIELGNTFRWSSNRAPARSLMDQTRRQRQFLGALVLRETYILCWSSHLFVYIREQLRVTMQHV